MGNIRVGSSHNLPIFNLPLALAVFIFAVTRVVNVRLGLDYGVEEDEGISSLRPV